MEAGKFEADRAEALTRGVAEERGKDRRMLAINEVFMAKLGKQLQYADSEGVRSPCAAILGEDELSNGTLTLKALASGAQSTVPIPEVSARLKALLEDPAAG